jgi:hypothetical protein
VSAGGSQTLEDRLVEEVRLGMALNGGVSLAVWMGGCAVELDCARRAHLAPEPAEEGAVERSVYNMLCTVLRRQLVIDVMSGTSAGGINGALLATAISHGRRLPAGFVRDRWLRLGDVSTLLQPTSTADPQSLMQGQLFHDDLLTAFDALCSDPATEPPPGQEKLAKLDVALDVTATNLAGERRVFADAWDAELVAREYRTRFRFRSLADYTAAPLAAAARSSASFPFAFEPWRADHETTELAGIDGARWMIDGGLLDNAPIAAALDLIPYRRATRQVRRYLCYLNADPPLDLGDAEEALPPGPPLKKIAGHLSGLPRKAPFVDQLAAIERATRRIAAAGDTAPIGLVQLGEDALQATAGALLGAYRHQRLRLSLDEILPPTAASAAFRAAISDGGAGDELPWIPASLAPTGGAAGDGVWQWGLRPAERVIFLLLDALRRAARVAPVRDRLVLFEARAVVEATLAVVAEQRRLFLGMVATAAEQGPAAALAEARALMPLIDPLPALRDAAAAVFAVAWLLDPEPGEGASDRDGMAGPVARGLFGPAADGQQPVVYETPAYFVVAYPEGLLPDLLGLFPLPDESFQQLLRTALAIEVVTRAVAPEEGAAGDQELRFVQLTPHSPGRVFAGPDAGPTGWASPRDKLTGIDLGHFAAFYRRSWRANDFMWGRLDAAARIVEMLVSPGRAQQLRSDGLSQSPAVELAVALVPEGTGGDAEDRRWLVQEALHSHDPDAVPAAPPLEPGPLRVLLAAALETDLMGEGASGTLTTAICTRAAQLEILRDELELLAGESAKDEHEGAGAPALDLPLDGDRLRPAIESLRELPTLPQRLTAVDEETSDLALRTGSHAGMVGLAMLRTARLPLASALFSARAALLPIAGSVSKKAGVRTLVVAAFWAAALLIAARLVVVGGGDDSLGLKWAGVVDATATLLAALVVVGVALVPGLRAWRAQDPARKSREWRWTAALLLAGGGAAGIVAGAAGLFSDPPPPTDGLPTWVAGLVVAFFAGGSIGGAAVAANGGLKELARKPWQGKWAFRAAVALALLVAAASVYTIVVALCDEVTWWRVAIVALAGVAAPLAAGLRLRLPLRGLRRST